MIEKNNHREPELQQDDQPASSGRRSSLKKKARFRRVLQEFLGGEILTKETISGNIGFILFLGLLAMIYISNTYYTEKIHKTINRTNRELKELRYKHITTKADLMFQGRQSEISKKALELRLKESRTPPYKIQYSGETIKQSGK